MDTAAQVNFTNSTNAPIRAPTVVRVRTVGKAPSPIGMSGGEGGAKSNGKRMPLQWFACHYPWADVPLPKCNGFP